MRKFISFTPLRPARHAGYTLIELAVVMVVAGVMTASFMSAYNLYTRTQAEKHTDDNISKVTAAMTQYLVAFGGYPCPAPIDVPRTSASYGVAQDCSAAGPAAGNFSGGVWGETTNRTISDTRVTSGNGSAALNAGAGPTVNITIPGLNGNPNKTFTGLTVPARNPKVRRGMVPFRTLGLVEDMAYDGYKMRLQYAVTEALAVPGTYLESGGAIDIQDGQGHSLFKPPGLPVTDPATGAFAIDQNGNSILVNTAGGAAHYVLFSTGVDQAGGYTNSGALRSACPATGLDAENCNTAATSIYVAAPYSTAHVACPSPSAVGDCHFDDHVKYYSEIESPLWKVSSTTVVGKDIQDLIGAGGVGSGKIGIGGKPSSAVAAAVQVTGDVRVAGTLASKTLCDAVGTSGKCTTVSNMLASTNTCPPGQVATSLVNGIVSGCQNASSGGRTTCGSGKIAHGFNGQQLICSQDVYCASKQVNLCQPPSVANADNRWLPASANGTVKLTSDADVPVVAPAVAGTTPANASGTSYVETWKCTGGTWSRTATSGVCNCTAVTNAPMSQTCYSYYGQSNSLTYTGNVTWTTSTVCPAGTTSTSTKDTSACRCHNLNISSVSTASCQAGYGPGPVLTTNHSIFTCAGGDNTNSIGSWSSTSDPPTGVCACISQPNDSQQFYCPYPYSGGPVTQTRSWTCASGTGSWGSWTPDMSGNPPPAPCTCTGTVEYDSTVPCGTGQTGTKTQMRTFDCSLSPPDWTGWSDYDTSQCGTLTYVWKPVGNPDAGTYGSALTNEAYKSCSPAGATSDCSKANNGTYIYYLNNGCQCE